MCVWKLNVCHGLKEMLCRHGTLIYNYVICISFIVFPTRFMLRDHRWGEYFYNINKSGTNKSFTIKVILFQL